MKIRLFCFLSAIFMLAGLLMPVGVYADANPPVDPSIEVIVDIDPTTATEPCESSAVAPSVETLDGEVESAEGEPTGTTNPCGGDEDGGTARVSWNS